MVLSKEHSLAVAATAAAALAGIAWLRSKQRARSAATPKHKQRVCIIGSGPSGLATMRAFQTLADQGEPVPELVCYEKQSNWGGLWNYSWRTGIDENGNTVHSSMYKYLWSNAPKECLEFADYSFEEHFGRSIASYPPRPVLFDYIQGRAEKSGIRKYIQFNTNVESTEYDDATGKFTVKTCETVLRDPDNPRSAMVKKHKTEEFDYVVCASGHYAYPNYPNFQGLESFQGRVLHAHDMRDACEFKGLDVLLVGTSYSAEDIASQVWKYGAKSVAISHRTSPIGHTTWPDDITEVPLLTKVVSSLESSTADDGFRRHQKVSQQGGTAYFADGSSKHVDAIILCTGYLHHFPFLSDELRLNPHDGEGQPINKIWLKGLYRGIFWMKNPKLIHIGPHTGFFTMNLFDAQAWLCRDFIMGTFKLPDAVGMSKYDAMMCDRAMELEEDDGHGHYDHRCIHFQGNYMKELIDLTDYPSFDVEETKRRFFEWEEHKQEGIMTFRDNAYKSVVTGNMAALLLDRNGKRIMWKDAMADTCESFGLWDMYNGNVRKTTQSQ